MSRALYLIGAPGVGKSSVMDELLSEWTVEEEAVRLAPTLLFGHWMARDDEVGLYVGVRRPKFSGTDAFGMAVMPHAVSWVESAELPDLVLAEGAKLGSPKFLVPLSRRAELLVALLTASPEVLADRRAARATNQDSTWLRGAETRAREAARRCRQAGLRVVEVDASGTSAEVADNFRAIC